jgi:hypothetical protein
MTLRLNGATSGFTEIDAPAVAGSNTLVLPGGNGSANQFLKNGATAGALAFGTTTEDVSGNLAFNSGYGSAAVAYGCRAWVNFNGTGAVAISASGNVSSITDNGTGDYTVNFTTALVDANFSAVVGIGGDSTSAGNGAWAQRIRSRTTSNIRLWTVRPDNGNLVDSSDANVAFFR